MAGMNHWRYKRRTTQQPLRDDLKAEATHLQQGHEHINICIQETKAMQLATARVHSNATDCKAQSQALDEYPILIRQA